MIINCDVDGVLGDFHSVFLGIGNKLLGKNYRHEDATTWDIDEVFGPDSDKIWKVINTTPKLVQNMPVYKEWLELLQVLGQLGHRINIVTSPVVTSPYWMFERYTWLFGLGFTEEQIFMGTDKEYLRGDVLVEDKPENCERWVKENRGLALLVDRPWNASAQLTKNVIRTKSPVEARAFITTFRHMREIH